MRVVLDVNVLVSALIISSGDPAAIYQAWTQRRFTLLTCQEHLAELRATLRKPRLAPLVKAHQAGRMVNEIRGLAESIGPLPPVDRSPDRDDNYLLALAQAGRADWLVSGDKLGLLALRRHRGTRIVSPAQFAHLLTRG